MHLPWNYPLISLNLRLYIKFVYYYWFLSCALSPAGRVPATGFVKQSGLHMDSKGFITVNKVICKAADPKCFGPILFNFFFHETFCPDNADECRRGLCWRRRGDVSLPATQQQEGEHPSLANGSCARWVCHCLVLFSFLLPICGYNNVLWWCSTADA